jgi:hypothetical protein
MMARYSGLGFFVGSHPAIRGSLLAPIDINQNGAAESTLVWTGSNSSGTAWGGINDLGQTFPILGNSALANGGWIATNNAIFSDNFIPFYALSSVITVQGAAATPEPVNTVLLPGAILLLAGLNRVRRRSSN